MRFCAVLCSVILSTSLIATDVAKPVVPSGSVVAGVGKVFGGPSLVDKSMNPALSVNGLFLGAWGTAVADKGLAVQELEAVFTASVDPYFFGTVILNSERLGALGVEEAYAVTLGLPMVTLKVGKFLSNFGKNNLIHTHGQPLIDRPLVNATLLGADGLNSVGMEASLLVPVPWYFDLTVGAIRAEGTPVFGSGNAEAMALTAHMDHLFDLTDATTLGIGGSFGGGDNAAMKKNIFMGADLTLKYLSGRGRGDFALAWTNEWLHRSQEDAAGATTKDWGVYSTLLARVSQQWWVGGRFDYVRDDTTSTNTKGENLILAYVPSEFSSIRLQGGLLQPAAGGNSQWQTLLQYNMTIGSHPAHAY